MAQHKSLALDDIPDIEYDFVATMGCGDACPNVRAKARADWPIADPKHMAPDAFRAVRTDIENRVRALLEYLARTE